MDIPRERAPNRRRYIYGGIGLLAIIAVVIGVASLKPAAPSVDRSSVVIDSVRRGDMVIDVRGPGSLVPEQIRWVSAITAGRVDRIDVRPGATVTDTTTLLELSNPDVQLEALSAQQQLNAAEAALVNLRISLSTQKLAQEGVVATTTSDYNDAMRNATAFDELEKKGFLAKGLLAPMDVSKAKDKAVELKARMAIEKQRLDVMSQSIAQQIELQKSQVDKLRDIAQFQQSRIASMQVRAGAAGQVTELSLEPGQYVLPGTNLAKVAQPGRLKAVLHIPETQAKDIQIGQVASIDTRNGLIPGHVIRIDPGAVNGTVEVDVGLDGALPKGARPDLSVDGTIELDRLKNVLYVGRPAYGEPESTVGIFKLTNGGKEAQRVNVKLGRASVNMVEVVQGLSAGDRIITSDMSGSDTQSRVRLQ
ncbi:MAG TPA: HlyD family efflux transporter periplasmic adaptor subunit [Gemmatimonadaceae bacterium]|nr:HlyD family efflux transporter periplasmic adaptor subunit [Gemmatimonadaceae bacterium]